MPKHIAKKISTILLFVILLFNFTPALADDDIESYNNCTGDCYDKYAFNESDYGKLAVCIETCDYTYPQGKTACSLEGYPACVRIGSSVATGSTIPPANDKCGKSFCLNIPIGQLTGFDVKAGNSILGEYIKYWYGFLLGTVGILATVMIMWGGFKYLVSRGDKASIESAKTQMISAVTGVVLAFGTYTLLYLINPALLTINTPNLPGIQGGDNVNLEQDATAGGGSPISPASLLPNENVLYSTNNSDWNAQHALSGTPTFVNTATTLMNNLQSQGKLPPGAIVTSGWRSGTGTSWHHTGQAFDMTWPGITQDNAQSFVNAVIAENPNLSYIIETNGENGSTWTSYGMGVHIDARPGTPYREQ